MLTFTTELRNIVFSLSLSFPSYSFFTNWIELNPSEFVMHSSSQLIIHFSLIAMPCPTDRQARQADTGGTHGQTDRLKISIHVPRSPLRLGEMLSSCVRTYVRTYVCFREKSNSITHIGAKGASRQKISEIWHFHQMIIIIRHASLYQPIPTGLLNK